METTSANCEHAYGNLTDTVSQKQENTELLHKLTDEFPDGLYIKIILALLMGKL